MKKHLVIGDTQVKPGISLAYLSWIGRYIVDKQPEVIVMIGDFADMPSLSSYDVGKKSFEGRTYKADIRAVHKGMETLLAPMNALNNRLAKAKKKLYKPKMVLTMGNHEQRINTAIEYDRKLDGLISFDDLQYKEAGWEVVPFLEVKEIDGVAYSHYFASGVMGRPVTSANALLTKKHMSCVAGHQQGHSIAYGQNATGKQMTAIISGSCYLHDENYLSHQTNQHWRGLYMLHNVENGSFDECAIPLHYLKRKYAK
jgi:hypothetical protein